MLWKNLNGGFAQNAEQKLLLNKSQVAFFGLRRSSVHRLVSDFFHKNISAFLG